MYGAGGWNVGSIASTIHPGETMQSKVKDALMTTGAVLLTIFVLNKISFTRNLVQTALSGG
jgi:hypothetical protein